MNIRSTAKRRFIAAPADRKNARCNGGFEFIESDSMLQPSSPLTRTNPPNGIALIDQITPLRVQPNNRGGMPIPNSSTFTPQHPGGEEVAELVDKDQDSKNRNDPETTRQTVREQTWMLLCGKATRIAAVAQHNHATTGALAGTGGINFPNPPIRTAGSTGSRSRSGGSCVSRVLYPVRATPNRIGPTGRSVPMTCCC